MIARTSFQLLLLANLVLAGLWLSPRLGMDLLGSSGREPERLETQLHPERVRLLGEASAPAAAAPSDAASQPVVAEPAAGSAAGGQICVEWAALSSEQVAALNAAVRSAGDGLTLREEALPGTRSYWVNIPPQGGRAGAEKRVADLRQMGYQDIFVIKDEGPDQWAVSLGLYRNEAAANRFFEGLQKKNIRTAKITVRENASSRIRLSGTGELIERARQSAAESLKGSEPVACAAG